MNPRLPTYDEFEPNDWDGEDWADRTGVRLGDLLDADRGEVDREYPENWGDISKTIRTEAEWICEECGIDLARRRNLLHVHHRDSDKGNNIRSNLQSLCVLCHSRAQDHEHLLDRLCDADRAFLLAHSKMRGL